ncbi:MAG: AlpA family phage regulatory protein [Proteobacteria bacterium]|nr:AlpA family phage regulatory protein [Pseudomonadota bacterium]
MSGSTASICGALPVEGFVRLETILKVIPVSKSQWWKGVKLGHYPSSLKIGPKMTVWRVDDIRALIESFSASAPAKKSAK